MISAKELRIGNWVKHNDLVSGSEYPDTVFQWSLSHFYDLETNSLSLASIDPIPLTPEILERVGFKAIPHYTVQESMTFEVGRLRYLSIGDIGTANEMLWLCERDRDDANKVNDLICLHNYDYDGKLYLHKLQNIVHTFGIELNPLLTNGK